MLLLLLIFSSVPRVFSQSCQLPWLYVGSCIGGLCPDPDRMSCSLEGNCCYDSCPEPIGSCLGDLCPSGNTCIKQQCCPNICPNNTGECDNDNKCPGAFECRGGVCCPQTSGPCDGGVCSKGYECRNDLCFAVIATTTGSTVRSTNEPSSTQSSTQTSTGSISTSGTSSPTPNSTQSPSKATTSILTTNLATTPASTATPCISNQTSCSNGKCPEGYVCSSDNYCMQCKTASGLFISPIVLLIFDIFK